MVDPGRDGARFRARGGANSFLRISEWGYVQCEDLRRSEEILTGVLPSAKDGTIPFGPVVRWDLEAGDDRALLYYLPAKDRFLLFSFTTSKAKK